MAPLLQIAAIFAIPIGLALCAFVPLYIEGRALYWSERRRARAEQAAIDAAMAKATPRRRTRPVAPFIVTPASDFWVDRAGNAFVRAVI